MKTIDTALRMRVIHKRLDGLISISKYLFDYYQKWLKNVILLPPLIDKTEDKWGSWNIFLVKTCVNLFMPVHPEKEIKIRSIGYWLAYQTVKSLKIRPFQLTIVGINKEQYLKSFNNNNGIPDKIKDEVKFLGRVTHKEAIDTIKCADYSIFIREQSRKNNAGFPTKFVEVSCMWDTCSNKRTLAT